MKKTKGLVVFLLMAMATWIPTRSVGQDSASASTFVFKPEISLYTGLMRFYGDVGYDQLNEPYKTKVGFQLEVKQEITPSFHISLYLLQGKLTGFEKTLERNMNFQTSVFSGGMQFHYDFGPLLPEKRFISPYVNLGLSYMYFKPMGDLYDSNNERYYFWNDGSIRNTSEGDPMAPGATILRRDHVYETDLQKANIDGFGNYPLVSLAVPVGGGVNLHLSDEINFKIGANLHYTYTDFLDNVTEDGRDDRKGRGGNDRFLFTYMGLSYNLSPRKTADDLHYQDVDFFVLQELDEDLDGVRDFDDQCPETPEGQPVDEKGCPLDDDHDGVPNFRDQETATLQDTLVDTRGNLMTPDMILQIYMEYIDSTGKFGFDAARHIHIPEEYRILVGTFDKGIPNDMMDAFLSIEDLKTEKDREGQTLLTVGSFPTAEEAEVKRQVFDEAGIEGTEVIQWLPEFSKDVSIDHDVVAKLQETQTAEDKIVTFDGLLYRVQLGAFRNEVPQRTFEGIEDLNSLTTSDGIYKYMSGTFKSYKDAAKHKIDMLVKGFEGAFVVAYKDGKQIDITRALEAEKNQPVVNTPDETPEQENNRPNDPADISPEDGGNIEIPADSVNQGTNRPVDLPDAPDTLKAEHVSPFDTDPSLKEKSAEGLFFFVQIARFEGDIPVDPLSKILTLENVQQPEKTGDGITIYTSGNFATYAEAETYIRKATDAGLADPMIKALQGDTPISLDEAGQVLSEQK